MATYYAKNGGSDGAAGTSDGTAWATLAHAAGALSNGDTLLLKRGSTWRELFTPVDTNLTIDAYGSGADPIISGGEVVTDSWAQKFSGTALAPVLGNSTGGGQMSGFMATLAPSGGTPPTIVQSAKNGKNNTSADVTATLASSPTVGNRIYVAISIYAGTITPPSGFTALDSYPATFNTSSQFWAGYRDVQSGDGTDYTFSTSGSTWGDINVIEVAGSSGIDQIIYNNVTTGNSPWTMPDLVPGVDNSLAILMFGRANGTGSLTVSTPSGWTAVLAETASYAPVMTFSKSAPTAGTPSGTYYTSVSGSTHFVVAGSTPLSLGASSSTLASNEWYLTGGRLYVNYNSGTDPTGTTVEVSRTRCMDVSSASGISVSHLDLRFGEDGFIKCYSAVNGFTFDSLSLKWGHEVSNSGAIIIASGNTGGQDGIITNCTFTEMNCDPVWVHDTPNVEIGYCTMTKIAEYAGDIASDGIQFEDSYGTTPNSDGFYIHDNTITMGANVVKGCILVNSAFSGASSSGIIERNVCTGGNYGVAVHASDVIVRNNTLLDQSSAFGGGIHVDSSGIAIDNVDIYQNLIANSDHAGIIVQGTGTARTDWNIWNNTIVNCAWAGVHIDAPIDGEFKNNIIWTTGSYTNAAYKVTTIGAGGWDSDYNLIGPEAANFIDFTGTDYATLAAYVAGKSKDAHSLKDDPLLTNPGSGDFTVGPTSPAINAGVNVGLAYNGSAPDIGYYETNYTVGGLVIYDREAPTGEPATYRVRAIHDFGTGTISISDWVEETTAEDVETARWRVVHPTKPWIDISVDLRSFATQQRASRRTVLQPLGRSDAVVLSDTRGPETGSITFRSPDDATLAAIRELATTTDPVLLVPPSTHHEPLRWVSLGDEEATRLIDHSWSAERDVTYEWTVVERPDGAVESWDEP